MTPEQDVFAGIPARSTAPTSPTPQALPTPEEMTAPVQGQVEPSPAPAGALDDVFADIPAREHPLEEVYKNLPTANPDQAAEIVGLARRTGQPEAFVEAHLPDVKAAVSAPTTEYWHNLSRTAPITAKHLEDPRNMAMAHDDIEPLAAGERIISGLNQALSLATDGGRARLAKQLTEEASAGLAGGAAQARAAELSWGQMMRALTTGAHDTTQDAELADLNAQTRAAEAKRPKGFSPVYYAAQQLPNLGLMARKGLERGVTAGTVFGVGAAIAGQLGPQAALPEEVATVPAAALLGLTVGGRMGAAEASMMLEGGAAYQEFIGLRDRDGNPVNPRLAAGMALAVGAANAGLEYLSLAALLKNVPGARNLLGVFGEKALSGMPAKRVKQAAIDYLTSIGTEAATEVLQESTAVGGGEAVKALSGQTFDPSDPRQMLDRILSVAGPAAQASLLMGLPGTIATAVINHAQTTKRGSAAEPGLAAYQAIGAEADRSALMKRSPEAYREHLAAVTAGGQAEHVFIPAEAFAEYCKGKGQDPAAVADHLGVGALYQMASETGGDMQIPTADWVVKTKIAGAATGLNLYQDLAQDVKFDAEGYTPRQKEAERKAMDISFEKESKAAREADPETETAWNRIYEDYKNQLREAKRPAQEADAGAKLFADMAVATAARTIGKTPDEVARDMVLKIVGVRQIVTPEMAVEQAKKKFHAEASREVDNRPEYQAEVYLRRSLGPGYRQIAIKAMEEDKISPEIRRLFESAGDAFGLGAAEEMIKIIAALPRKEDAVNELLDLRLQQQFGEGLDQRGELYQYAGGQLADAKRMAAEGKPAAEIESATGWRHEGGQWQYKSSMTMFRPESDEHIGDRPDYSVWFQAAPPTESPEFKKWFGDSKVKDKFGKPIVVYHGTNAQFEIFDKTKSKIGPSKFGFWFTEDKKFANMFGENRVDTYLAIKKPKVISSEKWDSIRANHAKDTEWFVNWRKSLKREGYDGLKIEGATEIFAGQEMRLAPIYSVFEPTQIKSVNNRGTWDPNNPNILYQAAPDEPPTLWEEPQNTIPRTSWNEKTGRVIVHSTIPAIRNHPGFKAAKSGNIGAAFNLVTALIKNKKLNFIVPGDGKPVYVVPVRATEKTGFNAIPRAFARLIAERLNFKHEPTIYQVNRVHHTSKTAMERLKSQAVFDGEVERGAHYIIVDDVVTQGGTLANLKSFIESKGGDVIGVQTLGQSKFSANLKPGIDTLNKLRHTYGKELDHVLRKIYGNKTEPETLTESEARTLIANRDQLLIAAGAGGFEEAGRGGSSQDNGTTQTNPQINSPDKTKLAQSARGAFDPAVKQITLAMGSANKSTFIHEAAHAWLNATHEYIKTGQATEGYIHDWEILRGWLGVGEQQEHLTSEQQEKFAYHFEAYLMEGKAPKEELIPVFARFKMWLMEIYQTVRDIGRGVVEVGEISPAVRGVMDRMLASEEQIAAVESHLSPEGIDLTDVAPAVVAKLGTLRVQAHEEAVQKLFEEQIAELSADRQEFLANERSRLNKEIGGALSAAPEYKVIENLRMLYPKEAPKYAAQEYLKDLADGTENNRQIVFEILANDHGFYSAEEMAGKILQSRDLAEEVTRRVDRELAALYPEIRHTEAIWDEAARAVHDGEKAAEIVALEGEILESKVRRMDTQVRILERARQAVELAKEKAQKAIDAKSVGEILATTPGRYYTAERVAAVQVAQAIARNDWKAAAQAKRRQLINHSLAIRIQQARESVLRDVEQIKKNLTKKLKLFKKTEAFNQVAILLEKFGFGRRPDFDPSTVTENLHEFASRLNAFFKAEQEDFTPLMIPDWILNLEGTKDYRTLSPDQLDSLNETIKNIQHVANMQDQFFAISDKLNIREMAKALATAADKNVNGRRREKPIEEAIDKFKSEIQNYKWEHSQIDTMLSILDGGEQGPWYLAFKRMANERGDEASRMAEEAGRRLSDLLSVYSPQERRAIFRRKILVPEFGVDAQHPITKETLLAMALNMGNDGNRERLLQKKPTGFEPTFEWSLSNAEQTYRTIINVMQRHLDEKDWKLVQGVWDMLESYWPEISKFNQKMSGFAPGKVRARNFDVVLPDGRTINMKGGYYPLKKDYRSGPDALGQAEAEKMLAAERNIAIQAHTRHGFTEPRTGGYYSVNLSLKTVTRHLTDVIHDLHFRDLVIDMRRLVSQQEFYEGVAHNLGIEAYKKLKEWVGSVAEGGSRDRSMSPETTAEKFLRITRTHAVASVIMLSLRVASQNLSNAFLYGRAIKGFSHADAWGGFLKHGLFNYLPKTAGRVVSLGWSKASLEMRRWVWERSQFMKDRAANPDPSIAEYDKIFLKDAKGIVEEAREGLRDFSASFLSWSDDWTAVPMWTTAYYKILNKGGSEKEAVEFADNLIRSTVGSARKIDLAPALRSSSEAVRIFTSFYGFWNVQLNRSIREVKPLFKHPIKNLPALSGYFLSQLGFIIAGDILAFRGPKEDATDEEKFKYWMALIASNYFSYLPIWRDLANMGLDLIVGNSYVGYRPSPGLNAAGKAVMSIWKAGAGWAKGADLQQIAEPATDAVSFIAGYPRIFNSWFWNFVDWFNGMDPELADLIQRRPKGER